MGCSVSTSADPVIANELKRSRHSRRRMSMDSKFIEERHQHQNEKPASTSNSARNDTPSGGGASGRTTSTALSYETASAGGSSGIGVSTAVRYSNLRSIGRRRNRTWSHARRVNSEPNTEMTRRRISPSSWSTAGVAPAPIAADSPLKTNQRSDQSNSTDLVRRRQFSATSQASFVLIQRRVVVAWEAPPALSPIRHQQQKPKNRHDRLSRTSSCTWPSASASGASTCFGSQTCVEVIPAAPRPSNHSAANSNHTATDSNRAASGDSSDIESLMVGSLRVNSLNNQVLDSSKLARDSPAAVLPLSPTNSALHSTTRHPLPDLDKKFNSSLFRMTLVLQSINKSKPAKFAVIKDFDFAFAFLENLLARLEICFNSELCSCACDIAKSSRSCLIVSATSIDVDQQEVSTSAVRDFFASSTTERYGHGLSIILSSEYNFQVPYVPNRRTLFSFYVQRNENGFLLYLFLYFL